MIINYPNNKQTYTNLLGVLVNYNCRRSKLLHYIVERSSNGFYYAQHGSRKLICNRLKINKSTYSKYIGQFVKSGLLIRRENAMGNNYPYYELAEQLRGLSENSHKKIVSIAVTINYED